MKKIVLIICVGMLFSCNSNKEYKTEEDTISFMDEETPTKARVIAQHNGAEFLIKETEYGSSSLVERKNGKERTVLLGDDEKTFGYCDYDNEYKCVDEGIFFVVSRYMANDVDVEEVWFMSFNDPYHPYPMMKAEGEDEDWVGIVHDVKFEENSMTFKRRYLIYEGDCNATDDYKIKEYTLAYHGYNGSISTPITLESCDSYRQTYSSSSRKSSSSTVTKKQSQSAPWGYDDNGIPYSSNAEKQLDYHLKEFMKEYKQYINIINKPQNQYYGEDYLDEMQLIRSMDSHLDDLIAFSRQLNKPEQVQYYQEKRAELQRFANSRFR